MTDSNRARVSWAKETTLGTLNASARLRIARITGENLNYEPVFFTPDEIRSDRMTSDPVKVNERNDGPVNFELHYPVSTCELSDLFESNMLSTWITTPERDNDGVADSVITAITVTTDVITVTTGSTFVAGQLIQTSGFANAANNKIAKVTTGGATSITALGAAYATETAPPAAARVKVVGLEGASGNISATVNGLSCTIVDFVAAGIIAGMWLKVGGSAAGTKFTTAANNDWIRVVSVTSSSIIADNLPAGWTADAGTGKTIRLFFGDVIRNGTTVTGLSVERSHLGQTTPTHILQKGMCVDQLSLDFTSEKAITGVATFMGMSGSQGTVANGTTYAAATNSQVMNSSVSVGRIAVGGSTAGSPNWVKSLKLTIKNNLRMYNAVGTVGAVNIGQGEVDISGTLETYFGSNAYLTALFAGTQTSINSHARALSQAFITTLPRITFTGGSPNAAGKNQDVVLPLGFTSSYDPTTGCEIQFDRVEYYEV